MYALGAALAGIHRRPLGVAVLLIVSLVFGSAAIANRFAGLDAEARAELTAERDRLAADIAVVTQQTEAVRTIASAADQCVRDAATALQPAVAASSRFSASTIDLGESVIARAAPLPEDAASQPAATESVEAGTMVTVKLF